MALHKGLLNGGFKLPQCEKHFHDHDETWVILEGKGTGYWIDAGGKFAEFELIKGDVWMIPAGYEHGSNGFKDTGRNSDDFKICVFNGTLPEGCHKPGHYYMEKEGYLPTLELKKTRTVRYSNPLDIPGKMGGIIFPEKGRATLQDESTPGCDPGTVLCQTLYTGLSNGTERNFLMGGNYGGFWPSRCGYQNVGRVIAVGVGVKEIDVGDIIFSGDFCQHTQYFAAPATPDKLWVKLADSIDPKKAALLGVASVAIHDVRRAGLTLGEQVLVVGAGIIGQFTAQAARLAGAIVTVCDINEKRLELADSLGAHKTITLTTDPSSWESVKSVGPFDAVMEDSGAPILDNVIGASWRQGVVKHGSRVAIIAGRERVDYSFNAGQGYELSVLHAGHFIRDDLLLACRLISDDQMQTLPLIQDVIPAADAASIYERLRDNPGSLLGAVFKWA